MSRVCQITGTSPQVGNNVSHANNKTRKRWLPNLHTKRYFAPSLGRKVRLVLSKKGIKFIDLYGIDAAIKKIQDRGGKV